jgi:outer membrane receptor protein involved in Fe transport
MNKITLSLLLILLSTNIFAEDITGDASMGTLKGFVFDSNANQPLEYATITMIRKKDNQVVNGTITDQTGFFKIKGVEYGMYNIDITFIGYKTKSLENVAIKPNDKDIDIGQINLEPALETIGEAVVTADRPTMTYKIDKKIINVSQQHTSASGTAVEILENIPSVTVDIEGNVSLRGSSSFTVLIDNKPSLLNPSDALNQIPASSIESIEIITNPSAKYDPDGTAGIINIILKKNKLQGVSGVVNANYGSNNSFGGDFLLSFRREKFNFYLGADYNNRIMKGTSNNENITTRNDTSYYVFSNGDFSRDRLSSGIRGGLDFNLNALNSLSFGVRYGERSRGGSSDFNYSEWNVPSTTSITNFYKSMGDNESSGNYYSLSVDYVHKFLNKGHMLTGQFIYDGEDSKDKDVTELTDMSNMLSSGQISEEKEPEQEYRIKLDYTLPIGEKNKFEAGYQGRLSSSESENEMYLYNTTSGQYDFMSEYSHTVDSKRDIHALYSTYSSELGNLGYQLGLRGEYVDRMISLVGENQDYTLNRWDIFPTIHLSYNFAKDIQLMTSYTRRIERPRTWYLEPFITWSDAYNVRQGNPGLDPEYIDSYELSFQKKFGRNVFSVDGYYRITNNKTERVRTVFEDYDNVFLSSVENVGKDYSFGTEIMFSLDIFKWWHLDLMGNIYDYKIEGQLYGEDFSEESFNWNARFNNTLKLAKSTRLQINGMYNSPTVTAQGRNEGFVMANLALKQDFFKNKLSATLQIRDLLNTAGHKFTSEGPDFYSYRDFSPYSPMYSITLTYRINNYKPDRKGNRDNGEGMDDIGGEEF